MDAVMKAQRDTMSRVCGQLKEEVIADGRDGTNHVRNLMQSVAGVRMLGEVADQYVVEIVAKAEAELLALRRTAWKAAAGPGVQKTDFQAVREFNVAAGNTADTFNAPQVVFYTGMQCEELSEKLVAIGGALTADMTVDQVAARGDLLKIADLLDSLGFRLKSRPPEIADLVTRADPVALLDADLDIVVVSHGSVLSQGVDGDASMAEVSRANLSKLVNGKVLKDANGKIVKPEGWTPPNLAPFLVAK